MEEVLIPEPNTDIIKDYSDFLSIDDIIKKPKCQCPICLNFERDIERGREEKEKKDRAMAAKTKEPARTQKAKGIQALSYYDVSTPSFKVVKIEAVDPATLIGKFVRPCPMRPRHGFVDSRYINNEQEAQQIIEETRNADAEAEFVLMDKIEAEFSGIYTPGILTIGKGNDGATAGKSAINLSSSGKLVTDYSDKLFEAAEIKNNPYFELLWESNKHRTWEPRGSHMLWKVQLRDGPALPQTIDYIPEKLKVKTVIEATGDLLEWETKMKDVSSGTVIYHPKGSLASHYSVHAVLNKIPVLISREPKVGETLEPIKDQNVELNIRELRAGFYAAIESTVEYDLAARVMLSGLHHLTLWKGKQDFLLGLAMGFAYRLTVLAGLGEYRHLPTRKRKTGSRDTVYGRYWTKTFTSPIKNRFQKALKSFCEDYWHDGFGGESWFKFIKWAAIMHNELVDGRAEEALEALNNLVNSVHNNGWGFNKFIRDEELNEAANDPILILVKVAPFLYSATEHFEGKHVQLAKKFSFKRRKIQFPEFKSKFRDDEYITAAQIKIQPESKIIHIQYKTNRSNDRNKYKSIDLVASNRVVECLKDKEAYLESINKTKLASYAEGSEAKYYKLNTHPKKKIVWFYSVVFDLDKEVVSITP